MARVTQRKGDIAVARAIGSFTELGYDVSIPLTESTTYDLVVDDGNGLYRVQCKYISTVQVDLRRIHSNSNGYVVKRYSPTSYDWLYVYSSATRKEYLVKDCKDLGKRAYTPRVEHEIPAEGGGVDPLGAVPTSVFKTDLFAGTAPSLREDDD